jgi:hypothetical protein
MVARTNTAWRNLKISKAKAVIATVILYAIYVTPVAADWIDGKKVVLQGLDKITA